MLRHVHQSVANVVRLPFGAGEAAYSEFIMSLLFQRQETKVDEGENKENKNNEETIKLWVR